MSYNISSQKPDTDLDDTLLDYEETVHENKSDDDKERVHQLSQDNNVVPSFSEFKQSAKIKELNQRIQKQLKKVNVEESNLNNVKNLEVWIKHKLNSPLSN